MCELILYMRYDDSITPTCGCNRFPMFGFYEKRRLKRFLFSRIFLVFMSIPLFFMILAAKGAYEKRGQVSEKREALSANLALVEGRVKELESDIATLEDPRGIETELRSRYELSAEGEEVIVFVEEEEGSSKEQTQVSKEKGFFKRALEFIF